MPWLARGADGTDAANVGPAARAAEPYIMQLFIGAADGLESDDFERQLYVIRKRASHQLRFDESMEERLLFYICSLSTKVMIYKGMLNTEQVLKYTPTSPVTISPRTWRWCTRASRRTLSRAGIARNRSGS